MNKDSTIELQRTDCNCNDCKYMDRDMNAYNHSKTLHHLWQRQYFDLLNRKKIERAEVQLNKNEWDKALAIIEEVNSAKFAFNNDAHISFGECLKKMCPISFIPNTLMLENFNCFQHRRDYPYEILNIKPFIDRLELLKEWMNVSIDNKASQLITPRAVTMTPIGETGMLSMPNYCTVIPFESWCILRLLPKDKLFKSSDNSFVWTASPKQLPSDIDPYLKFMKTNS